MTTGHMKRKGYLSKNCHAFPIAELRHLQTPEFGAIAAVQVADKCAPKAHLSAIPQDIFRRHEHG